MSGDDKSNRGSPDRELISLTQPYEVRDWAKKFSVSEEELRAVVGRVGSSADAVARELGKPTP
jgi:hypothetical protein